MTTDGSTSDGSTTEVTGSDTGSTTEAGSTTGDDTTTVASTTGVATTDTTDATEATGTTEPVTSCGDEIVDPDEECDDGVDGSEDCTAECQLAPGAVIDCIDLELEPDTESNRAMALNPTHAIVGGIRGAFPDVDPPASSFAHHVNIDTHMTDASVFESADPYGRFVDQMAIDPVTGETIVVGSVWPANIIDDWFGYLWLARYAEDASIVASTDLPEIDRNYSSSAVVSQDGTIAAITWNFTISGSDSRLDVFSPALEPLWSHDGDHVNAQDGYYRGVAASADRIYAVGTRKADDTINRVLVTTLTFDSLVAWERTIMLPDNKPARGEEIMVGRGGEITIVGEYDYYEGAPSVLVVQLSKTGAEIVNISTWAPPGDHVNAYNRGVLQRPGGLYFAAQNVDDPMDSWIVRLNDTSEVVWARRYEDVAVLDLALHVDTVLYGIRPDALCLFKP